MSKKSKYLVIIFPVFIISLIASFLAYSADANKSTYLQLYAYDTLTAAKISKTKLAEKNISPLQIHPEKIHGKKVYELEVGPLLSEISILKTKNLLKKNNLTYFQKNLPIMIEHHAKHRKPHHSSINTVKRQTPTPVVIHDSIPDLFKTQSTQSMIAAATIPTATSTIDAVTSLIIAKNEPKTHSVPLPANINYNLNSNTIAAKVNRPTRLWNLRNVDIRNVIQEVSRETGKNFIVDPRVQGQISIISSTPIDADAVYKMFLSALDILGYSAVPQGSVIKIVPSIDAKQLAIPLATNLSPGSGDEPIVRVVSVKNVSAMELVPLLRPLIPDWGNLVAYAPSNVLIIAGNASNVSRVTEIIHRVDTTNTSGIDVMPLRYANASDVVKTIQQLQTVNPLNSMQASVAAETQSNTVLISGPQSARLKMRVLISELDTRRASGSNGDTQIIELHYLQARDVVPILAGVAQSYGSSVGTVIGTITNQVGYSSTANPSNANGSDNQTSNQSSTGSQAGILPSGNIATSQQQTTSQTAGESDKPRVEIIGEPNTNSIIINAPPALMSILKAVITQLDARPAQVLVEAMVAEIDENATAKLGIAWGTVNSTNATGIDNGFGLNATPVFQQGIGIINSKGFHNFQGVIQALANDASANILSTPSIVVLDNHEAKIEVGQQISVLNSNFPNNAGGTTNATPYNTFNQEKVALHLYVTPSINQNNTIQLAIDQGNNTLQNPNNPTTTPIINISSIQTSVLVNSGDILVLGGLIQNQVSKGDNKIPFLGDIPVIGHLFNVASHGHKKQMLMVFIRPIILHNLGENNQVSKVQYNFARNQQLNTARHQYYTPEINSSILKPWGKPVNLPSPFH